MQFELRNYRKPTRRFFSRDVVVVARALIGAYVRHLLPDGVVGGMIVETEAYSQFNDPGCHAFRGLTKRNRAMFGPPGHAYTYFTYGNHWMFNVVAESEGRGCAVLIRALEPVEGVDIMRRNRRTAADDYALCNGPGKLSQALRIGKQEYGIDLIESSLKIFIPTPENRKRIFRRYGGIVQTTRVGLSQGGELPYRFFLANHPCVSKKP